MNVSNSVSPKSTPQVPSTAAASGELSPDSGLPAAPQKSAPGAQGGAPLAFWNAPTPPLPPDLSEVCRLSKNADVVCLARAHGLNIVEVAWEDMSRFKCSSVGRNITDATLRAKDYPNRCSVLRSPNFTDHTGDFSIAQFQVKVGNETGDPLRDMPLRDYLNGLFAGAGGSQETISQHQQILVAPQSCVLPLANGECAFNMELFNYQTSEAYPAALAVVCTAEGTSAQVVTQRGAQKLFFNKNGQKCDFFAERLKQVREREGRAIEGAMSADEEERNILLLFQIPLRLPPSRRAAVVSPYEKTFYMPTVYFGSGASFHKSGSNRFCTGAASGQFGRRTVEPSHRQGIDHAQLGVSAPHGVFEPLPERFELDPDAAIRCTVQHYLVTDTGVLAEQDVIGVRQKMDTIYSRALQTGSLVVDTDASSRSTAPKETNAFWFFRLRGMQ